MDHVELSLSPSLADIVQARPKHSPTQSNRAILTLVIRWLCGFKGINCFNAINRNIAIADIRQPPLH